MGRGMYESPRMHSILAQIVENRMKTYTSSVLVPGALLRADPGVGRSSVHEEAKVPRRAAYLHGRNIADIVRRYSQPDGVRDRRRLRGCEGVVRGSRCILRVITAGAVLCCIQQEASITGFSAATGEESGEHVGDAVGVEALADVGGECSNAGVEP